MRVRRTASPLSYVSILHKGNASQKLQRGRNFSLLSQLRSRLQGKGGELFTLENFMLGKDQQQRQSRAERCPWRSHLCGVERERVAACSLLRGLILSSISLPSYPSLLPWQPPLSPLLACSLAGNQEGYRWVHRNFSTRQNISKR